MIYGEHTFTKGGNMRKVDMPTICQWIVDAWKELPIKTVVKGFKKCSISNILDGTEDDILWMEDADNDDDDEREDCTNNKPPQLGGAVPFPTLGRVEMACRFSEGLILGRFSFGQLFSFFIPAVQCTVTCGQHS